MVNRIKSLPWTSLFALSALLAGGAQAQRAPQAVKTASHEGSVVAQPKVALEPKAIDLLKAASSRLAAARSLAFTAEVTYESATRSGPPLAYTTKSEVTLRRPDRLRVITCCDGPASEFYYDGKTMTAFAPAEHLAAVAPAPPTIDGALKAAYDSAAIYYPFTDLIVADPYQDIASGLKRAYYIGQSHVVGGTTTDMVAYTGDGVFVQVWIGAEDKLPRMMRAIYLDDPLQLRHRLEISNWQVDLDVPADAFASSDAASAKRIPFARPDLTAMPDAKPPLKPAAPKGRR